MALFILKLASLYSLIHIKGSTALCYTSELPKCSDVGNSTGSLPLFCIMGGSHYWDGEVMKSEMFNTWESAVGWRLCLGIAVTEVQPLQ